MLSDGDLRECDTYLPNIHKKKLFIFCNAQKKKLFLSSIFFLFYYDSNQNQTDESPTMSDPYVKPCVAVQSNVVVFVALRNFGLAFVALRGCDVTFVVLRNCDVASVAIYSGNLAFIALRADT